MNTYMETPRLILRDWKEEDIPVFAGLNSNDQVMEFFLKKLSYQETLDFYYRIRKEFASRGYGLYAVEKKENHAFIGYVGLHDITFDVDFSPAVEIGWRLIPEVWNQGYAHRSACSLSGICKKDIGTERIIFFQSQTKRSERVMQKIGMVKSKEFDHPLVSPDHPLCRHVLYKISLINI